MKKVAFFLSALCVSVMTMAAEVQPKVTIDFSDSTNVWGFPDSLSKDTAEYTYKGVTVKVYPSTSTAKDQGYKLTRVNATSTDLAYSYLIFGKKNYKIELPAFDFKVGKIVVYGSSKASESVETNVFVGETAVSTSYAGAKLPNQLPTFAIAPNYRAAGNQYAIKVLSAHNMQITKIAVYEEVSGAPENPVFSPAGGIYPSAQSVTLTCATDGATIQYSYDGSGYLDYSAPLQVAYTQTIYAKAVKNQIESDVVAATYVIVSLEGNGTKNKPYTMADLAVLNNPGDSAWVGGYIIGCGSSSGALITDPTKLVDTNILLADSANATKGLPVQLSKKDHKEAIGVATNAGNVGRYIKVYGQLTSYMGKTGVKNTSDYEFVAPSPSAVAEVPSDSRNVTKCMENGRVVILINGEKYNALGTKL